MGNCVVKKAVPLRENETKEENEAPIREEGKPVKKKTVRFRLDEEEEEEEKEGGKGFVRIRVVVTREELRRMLNEESVYSSSEELLSALKLGESSRRRMDDDDQAFSTRDDLSSAKWRPVLESISEC